MSFDSTEDDFERFAREEIKDPRNKDMLDMSEDALVPVGPRPGMPPRPPAPGPTSAPSPPPRASDSLLEDEESEEDDESEEGDESEDPEEHHGGTAMADTPAIQQADLAGSVARYSEDVESEPEDDKPATNTSPNHSVTGLYSSPYRQSQSYSPVQSRNGQDRSPDRQVPAPAPAQAQPQQDSRDYFPRQTISPRESLEHTPRRPYSAGSNSWAQRSTDARSEGSERLSSPGYQGQRVRRVLREMMQRDPRTWDAMEVRYWLDFVGLSQHRYKFGAHALDGKTLFKLTDDYLKYEVGVHAIGHRQEILECIEDLKAGIDLKEEPKPKPRRIRPTSAPPVREDAIRGGALGNRSIQEQHQKLSKELDKAMMKAEQQARVAEEAARLANLATAEVHNIQKQLMAVKRAAKRQGLDYHINANGEEIWRPVGKGVGTGTWDPEPKRYGTDKIIPDKRTKPKMNPRSKEMMRGRDQSTPVWEKAEQDVAKLEGKIKEKRRQLEEEMAGPGNTSVEKMQRNKDYVLKYFVEHFMVEVPKDARQTMTVIEQTFDAFSDQIANDEKDLEALRKLKNAALVDALANTLRKKSFLGRLPGTIATHENELTALRKAAHRDPKQDERAAKDAKGQAELFESLGWVEGGGGEEGSEGITVERLNNLLKRARVCKIVDEEIEQGIQGSADQDPRHQEISNDGLEQLETRSGTPGALEKTVHILTHSMHEDLGKAMRIPSLKRKAAAVYKIYRTQRHYLESTLPDLQKREQSHHKLERGEGLSMSETVPTAPPGKYNGFMERLEEDMEKRAAKREMWIKQGNLSAIETQIHKVSNIKKASALFDDSNKSAMGDAAGAKSVVSFKTAKTAKTTASKSAMRYQD